MLAEDEVYVATKAWLRANGFALLAGQPPRGCDNLPVVEIKSADRQGKGSWGAFKPDLIAVRVPIVFVVECKPVHDEADARKLREFLGDRARRSALFDEVAQRRLLERRGVVLDCAAFDAGLRGVLAHSGVAIPQPDLATIVVTGLDGAGAITPALSERAAAGVMGE